MILNTDFSDYYDLYFDGSGVVFNRLSKNTGLNKKQQFEILKSHGFLVPPHGTVREVLGSEWEAEGRTIDAVVAYTDIDSHCGEGKIVYYRGMLKSNPHMGNPGGDRFWRERGEGKLTPFHTEGGHRRYYKSDIEKLAGIYVEPVKVSDGKRVGIYCRVSSHEQKTKGDLERQVGRMTTEALKRGYSIVAVFDEVGSGMNDNRKKLQKLFELVEKKEIDVVLIEHKDRLSRFCFNYLLSYFNSYGVRIEKVEEVMSKSFENELVEDILSLMASFSAKIYGRRSSQNRKKKEKEGLE